MPNTESPRFISSNRFILQNSPDMKTSLLRSAFFIAILSAAFTFSAPAIGDDSTSMLSQAFDLVHQAWNPGGDPLSADQRIDLLTKALKLAQGAPQHNVKGHRVKAIQDIRSALDLLKNGDPDSKAVEYIHDAASELRTSVSMAE